MATSYKAGFRSFRQQSGRLSLALSSLPNWQASDSNSGFLSQLRVKDNNSALNGSLRSGSPQRWGADSNSAPYLIRIKEV